MSKPITANTAAHGAAPVHMPAAPTPWKTAKQLPAMVHGVWQAAAQDPAMIPAGPKPQEHKTKKNTGTMSGPEMNPTTAPIATGIGQFDALGRYLQMRSSCSVELASADDDDDDMRSGSSAVPLPPEKATSRRSRTPSAAAPRTAKLLLRLNVRVPGARGSSRSVYAKARFGLSCRLRMTFGKTM